MCKGETVCERASNMDGDTGVGIIVVPSTEKASGGICRAADVDAWRVPGLDEHEQLHTPASDGVHW